jgi:hypothetical protein
LIAIGAIVIIGARGAVGAAGQAIFAVSSRIVSVRIVARVALGTCDASIWIGLITTRACWQSRVAK